jgi:predicted nucleic acid-binding protein
MTSLVVDSWAWVEYLDGSALGRKVDVAIQGASEIWTSVATVAEVVSKCRTVGKEEGPALRAMTTLSKIGVPTLEDAVEAGRIHSAIESKSKNFSFADSFVLQLARKVGAKVLTGDPDFKGFREAEFLG